MRLLLKIVLVVIIVAFVSIQFFQPEKNVNNDTKDHIFNHEELPESVKMAFKNACMDCHSNNTKYLWYHQFAPVSWMVNQHVIDGKDELNFSEWGQMDAYDKIVAVEDIRQELELQTMPLKSYLIMHSEAKLTESEKKAVFEWLDKKGDELVGSQTEQ